MKVQANLAASAPGSFSTALVSQDAAGDDSVKPSVELQEPAPNEKKHLVINGQGVSLQFATDGTTGRTIIRVVDSESGELIRQIPPEEVLDFLQNLSHTKGSILSRSL